MTSTQQELDTLTYASANATDRATMDAGCHFNYIAQQWVDGHDHAHFQDDASPLVFCGADAATCNGPASTDQTAQDTGSNGDSADADMWLVIP